MNHYWQTIQGWFNFQPIYSYAANTFPDGSNFLEIGSWKGASTSYLGVELINLNKTKTVLYCVDTWEGTPGEHDTEKSVLDKTLFNEFLNNIKPLRDNGLVINPVKGKSQDSSILFADNFFDFIYIDGSHYYNDVKEDIIKYLPKLKSTGVLAGHDWQCEEVVRAVSETLGLQNIKTIHNTWIYNRP